MPKPQPNVDVLVLGGHPSAYLAAALLRFKSRIAVVHSTIPNERLPQRLVLLNPAFFQLHPLLRSLRRKLRMTPLYGIQFLGNDPGIRSEYRSRSVLAYVVSCNDIRKALVKLADDSGVQFLTAKSIHIQRLNEDRIDITVGRSRLRPRAIILAGTLPASEQKTLSVPESWGPDVLHRYTFLTCKTPKSLELASHATLPMSLDLGGKLTWAWLLPGNQELQLAVEQPIQTVADIPARVLLQQWLGILQLHGILNTPDEIPLEHHQSIDLPLAGALPHEGLANRTLLIGPAGGFYSACGEDIYPNCWSAIFAADIMKKALKERHLQDALQPYRHKWRTTLGDYLRGPQQNLHFLLPLIYRNQIMTTRLAESILLGKSVVR